MKKRIKNRISSHAGTTMVEVLVAFLVVMLMMGLFTKAVTTSVSLLRRSESTIAATEAFDETYYKTAERDNRQTITDSMTLTGNGVSMSLSQGELQKYEADGITRYSIALKEQESQGE